MMSMMFQSHIYLLALPYTILRFPSSYFFTEKK